MRTRRSLFINVGILIGYLVGWALTPASAAASGDSSANAPAWRGPLLAIGAADGTKRASLLVPNPFFLEPAWWNNVSETMHARAQTTPCACHRGR